MLLKLNTEWAQVEVIDLINDGSGLAFGIIGGRSTGVVVKTILPGGTADRVSKEACISFSVLSAIFVPRMGDYKAVTIFFKLGMSICVDLVLNK